MADALEDIREHFRQALQSLCDEDFSTRGGERPTLIDLGDAYDHAEDAAEALKRLLSPPNPYADKALRPGLGYDIAESRIPSNPIEGDDHV